MNLCDDFSRLPDGTVEYFFNRNWCTFNAILDLYRIGSLHQPVDACAMIFKEDLAYWCIDELYLDPCCALKFYPEIENCQKEFKSDIIAKQREEDRKKYENFGESCIGKVRGKLWRITEYPESSIAAQVRQP